jgi:DNA end-binding protein Ku
MPRSLWSGSLSFGLVNVPVQLVSAARDLDYHFHQLHEKDSVRIEQRRFCSREDVEVGWEEIGHSYDLDGEQVVLSDEELGSVQPRKTRTIDIEAFVDLGQVDPIYFDHPYFLVPAGDSEGTLRAYRLLVEVMAAQERAALGRFVMRTKEYLVAVRARDGALTLTTMLFHDEVRPTKDIETGGKKPSKKQLEGAVAIIGELSTEWQPDRYEDCYRERLRRVIDAKRKRRTIEVPQQEKEPSPVSDLMAALERTLEQLKLGEDPRAEQPAAQRDRGAKHASNGGQQRTRAKRSSQKGSRTKSGGQQGSGAKGGGQKRSRAK